MRHGAPPEHPKSIESDLRRKDNVRAAIFVTMYLLLTVLALGLPGGLRASRTTSITYSDFLRLLRTNQVTEVVIAEHRIRGTVKNNPEVFETIRVEDPHLLEELERYAVKFAGDRETTSWWRNLFNWLRPIVLMIAVWNAMLRRMRPRQGAIAFERSRAKIYAEDDVKVTFAANGGNPQWPRSRIDQIVRTAYM